MDVDHQRAVSAVAAAIGEPARACMLFALMDGRARTSTELAVMADVSPSTASAHLNRLKAERLVRVLGQGRHRYYNLDGVNVAAALEALSVVAGGSPAAFVPGTPNRLRAARTCYDHMAGSIGVALHDRVMAMRWLAVDEHDAQAYTVTAAGASGFAALGIDLDAARALRRRFACACLDWSERRPHIGGALGAALLTMALKKRWVTRELDSRALTITTVGRREMSARLHLANCGSTSLR
jgi:DNA-binding transcriptional ArsR family regulator